MLRGRRRVWRIIYRINYFINASEETSVNQYIYEIMGADRFVYGDNRFSERDIGCRIYKPTLSRGINTNIRIGGGLTDIGADLNKPAVYIQWRRYRFL